MYYYKSRISNGSTCFAWPHQLHLRVSHGTTATPSLLPLVFGMPDSGLGNLAKGCKYHDDCTSRNGARALPLSLSVKFDVHAAKCRHGQCSCHLVSIIHTYWAALSCESPAPCLSSAQVVWPCLQGLVDRVNPPHGFAWHYSLTHNQLLVRPVIDAP